jgi:hypothetical protein
MSSFDFLKMTTDTAFFLKMTTDTAFSVNEQGEILSWDAADERLLGYPLFAGSWQGLLQVLRGRGAVGTQV